MATSLRAEDIKISVKNTFIEAAIEEDDDEPQPLAVWTKTAPGALLPQRFQFQPKRGDVVAAGVLRDESKDASPLSSRCELRFGEQSESVVKVSVKNTFIEAAMEEDDDEPQPFAVWTKTAPAALLPQRFEFAPKQGDVVAAGVVQSLASTQDDAEAAASVSSDTSSNHENQRIDWAETDEEDMDPSTEKPEASLEEKVAMRGGSEGHAIGQCVPCAYFWHKKDGCRLGENCKFCHLCNKGEVKKRKRELILQLKADGKYRPNFSRRQGK
jgi:hypothetical protein